MPTPTDSQVLLSEQRELDRIVSLQQAAELCNLSPDTFRRRYPDKLVKLSPRRTGVRLRDALLLPP